MIKMMGFEEDLANVMGSFMEVNLDCVEKQNQEIEQLQNNWNELKKYISAEWYCFDNESVEFEVARKIMQKAQELEGNNECI